MEPSEAHWTRHHTLLNHIHSSHPHHSQCTCTQSANIILLLALAHSLIRSFFPRPTDEERREKKSPTTTTHKRTTSALLAFYLHFICNTHNFTIKTTGSARWTTTTTMGYIRQIKRSETHTHTRSRTHMHTVRWNEARDTPKEVPRRVKKNVMMKKKTVTMRREREREWERQTTYTRHCQYIYSRLYTDLH